MQIGFGWRVKLFIAMLFRLIRSIGIFLLLTGIALKLQAQFDFPSMGGRSSALGGCSVALCDAESSLDNWASMGGLEHTVLSLSVRQQFVSEGMGYARFAAAVPVGFGAWGASLVHYGNSDYNEQQITLAYAIPAGRKVLLAAGLHYLHSATVDPYYNPVNLFTFSLSLQYAPSKRLTVGFKAYNPFAAELHTDVYMRTPARFNLGVAYRLIDELLAVVEAEKDLYNEATLRMGVEYHFFEHYAFRVGLNTHPTIYTFGFGMRQRHWGADVSAQLHQVLGMTPHLSAYYCF